ncbi:hypothetical protein N0V82_005015 [Gnomoniopsis sp. IMI 355080]|nr:hypothetical protein N0V82_005015 [Gnomoniopsis sp. IMI 355080]
MRSEEVSSTYSPSPLLQYGSGIEYAPPATHDTSRVNFHVKQIDSFAQTLQDSASRAFPNKGRSSQRYKSVQVLLLHWKTDDLFVLPELEDLEASFREEYGFNTDVFAIPADNPHLDLMMRIGSLIKDHESEDTLFIVYYGGHAKIDESRQSTWCATRHSGSPSLQWSAIQTLLERSISDVLILLDCCAGAASATFPNGKSTTETISASSWDAIAPDPGRYSFTNALIEVLGEWRNRTFSAAMLHAEVLARLKHPRPILINGKRFEARATPVHFMMTSDHRAPSIEMSRLISPDRLPPSPARDPSPGEIPMGRGPADDECFTEPNEDKPHVMISLALEDNQRLDLNAWEQWLSSFPALAKYVKVQGVFKSHSTLLLLSMPVSVWDLLPEDQACSFVAFIRSNNLVKAPKEVERTVQSQTEILQSDRSSIFSGTTFRDSILAPSISSHLRPQTQASERGTIWRTQSSATLNQHRPGPTALTPVSSVSSQSSGAQRPSLQRTRSTSSYRPGNLSGVMGLAGATLDGGIVRQPLMNQSRSSKRTVFSDSHELPECPPLAAHVVSRLEVYYHKDPHPSDGTTEYYASHLGIEAADVKVWFHHRRIEEQSKANLEQLKMVDSIPETHVGPQMILAGQLNDLLDVFPPAQILFVDLRSPSEFQRSHIHNAVNLRMPSKFMGMASLDMLDRTFPDEQSRRSFTRWSKTKCMVIYDRNIEASWECPIAPQLLDMLRRQGWPGRCFVLKGPFREFSMSFDKYITGDRMTKDSKKYTDGLRSATPPTEQQLRRKQARYEEWLRRVQHEGSLETNYSKPREVTSKKAAVDEHQRELEAEFKGRCPDLYRRMKDMGAQQEPSSHYPPAPPPKHGKEAFYDDDSYFDTRKAHLVRSLSTGLDKMRDAASTPGSGNSTFPSDSRVPDKLGELPSLDYEDFDEIDPREAQSPPYRPGAGGRSAASSTASGDVAGASPASSQDHAAKKVSREASGRQGLWKRLRSNNGK